MSELLEAEGSRYFTIKFDFLRADELFVAAWTNCLEIVNQQVRSSRTVHLNVLDGTNMSAHNKGDEQRYTCNDANEHYEHQSATHNA
ncbi:MAG: hypothetical protein PHP57_01515 [Sideroxydans sp.]|nr:hypothetical protein [Sideroxydans sp.]